MGTTFLLFTSLYFVRVSGLSLPPSLNNQPLSMQLALLRPPTAGGPSQEPSLRDVTASLAEISNAGIHPDDSWVKTLEKGSPWVTSFSAKPKALIAARGADYAEAAAEDPSLVGRRFAKGVGRQTFSSAKNGDDAGDGSFTNSIALCFGLVRFSFSGSFSMTGRRMTLVFEKLTVRLLRLIKLNIDIREGRGIRALIERVRGGKRKTKKVASSTTGETAATFEKRPNIYAWCFADDTICVAQGSSGSVALWVSEAAFAKA